jgi:hypothetical protein
VILGFLDWAKLGAGAALGAALMIAPAYFKGKAAGRQEAAVSALETSVKILRKKGEIDVQVSTADAASLCADYGLSDDDEADCLRRVRAASAEAGDDSLHPAERPPLR